MSVCDILADNRQIRFPDKFEVIYEENDAFHDCAVKFTQGENELKIGITANESHPTMLRIFWSVNSDATTLVLGDAWERSYKDLEFLPLDDNRVLPWYFAAITESATECLGVKTGSNSFVSFKYSKKGIEVIFDIKNGSFGVHLNGRELDAATLIYRKYPVSSPFSALQSFCRCMCDNPLSPSAPVYGGNNWYYAYGKSSRDEILNDSMLIAELAEGLHNRPFMVIDDCWQKNPCAGPWEPNEAFGDMKALAAEMKSIGVRPGLWVRFLKDDRNEIPLSWRVNEKENAPLDASVPDVLNFIASDIEKFKEWGFELLKHDFSTFDIFDNWGKDMGSEIPKKNGISFHDKTKTNAEIVLNLYKTIKKAAGDMIVIGCNTVSHLSAGLVEINRIGDDTSGKEWSRTLDYGVNTLAFRLPQHKAFYDIDADCVGIIDNCIPWGKNSLWLRLLKYSGTPLFVSCSQSSATDEIKKDIKAAFAAACKQTLFAEPIDFTKGRLPKKWNTSDGEAIFNW